MSRPLLSSGTVFYRADPYMVSEYINQHIGKHSFDLQSRSAKATLRHKSFGPVGLSCINYGGRALVRSPGLKEDYHLQVIVDGNCSIRYKEKTLELPPGWAAFINPQQTVELGYSTDCEKMIINLPVGLMREVCAERFGHVPDDGFSFQRDAFFLDRDSPMFRLLELVYLEADDADCDNLRISQPLCRLLASKLIEVFPHNLGQRTEGRHAAFFAAIDDWILKNIHRDIAAEELAERCNVSVSTLYCRFRELKGMTPGRYARDLKLHDIRRRMTSGQVRSITSIALEHGFSHLGRFSSEYKNIFGELPSETLRRIASA